MFENLKPGDKVICVNPYNTPPSNANTRNYTSFSWKKGKIFIIKDISVHYSSKKLASDIIYDERNNYYFRCTLKKIKENNQNGRIINLGKEFNFKQ